MKLAEKKAKRKKAALARSMDKRPGGERVLESDSVLDDDGNNQKILRRGVALKNFENHLVTAAARFSKDWNLANAGTMKGMPWKARVDGGAPDHKGHLERMDAQARISQIEQKIGPVNMALAVAVAVFGFSAPQIHKQGGPARVEITKDIKSVLGLIGEYYDRKPHKRNPMMDVLTRMIETAMQEPDRV